MKINGLFSYGPACYALAVCSDGPAIRGSDGSVVAEVVCRYVPSTSQVVSACRQSHIIDIVVSLSVLENTNWETPWSTESTCWQRYRWAAYMHLSAYVSSVCLSVHTVVSFVD